MNVGQLKRLEKRCEEEEAIVAAVRSGEPVQDVAARFGRCRFGIYQICKAAGVEFVYRGVRRRP